MSALDHWHPVLLSKELGKKPVAVTLNNTQIVLFRTASGKVGALEDRCPHRSMTLSKGWVCDGRIVCPYHGWAFEPTGHGESPGSPKMRTTAVAFDVEERHRAIWVKAAGAKAEFPKLDFPGFSLLGILHRHVKTPYEVLLDNFTEIEHTPYGHAYFGAAESSIAEVRTKLEVSDDQVRVTNVGVQRKIPWIAEKLLGLYSGDRFTYEWTTFFSPVYTIYYMWWHDPKTGRQRKRGFSGATFFSPINERETCAIIFYYVTKTEPGLKNTLVMPLRRALKPVLAHMFYHEFELDRDLVENLRETAVDLSAHQLGRFDRALIEQRRRVKTLYEGQPPASENGNGAHAAEAAATAEHAR